MNEPSDNTLLTALLSRVKVVMIGTTLPANIGSAARAMHTMGLSRLTVVNPRLPVDDSSRANAAGALSVLANVQIVDDVASAVADCALIFAASARSRQMPRPVVTPSLSAQIMLNLLTAHLNDTQMAKHHTDDSAQALPQIAILFGREDRGLTNDELALADYHIQIPANPVYPVLNVASAVQVISAAVFERFANDALSANAPAVADFSDDLLAKLSTKQTQGSTPKSHQLDITIRSQWDEPAVTAAQMADFEAALIMLMQKLNIAKDAELGLLPNRLSRLGARLQLDQKEYALLRALIARMTSKLNDA